MTAKLYGNAIDDHDWIVINALPWQDLPLIKAARFIQKVPLTNHRRPIAGGLQKMRKGDLIRQQRSAARQIAAIGIVHHSVGMRILACENGGSRRAAQRIGRESQVEPDPLPCYAVHVWSLKNLVS